MLTMFRKEYRKIFIDTQRENGSEVPNWVLAMQYNLVVILSIILWIPVQIYTKIQVRRIIKEYERMEVE